MVHSVMMFLVCGRPNQTLTHLFTIKMTACRDIAPCSLVQVYRLFRRAYCLHHKGDTPMIEAVRTSKTLAMSTTLHAAISQKDVIISRRLENLKSCHLNPLIDTIETWCTWR
jgi:hypothetical protein